MVHGASHIHYYIDGVECTNSPLTTNIPDDAGDYLMPFTIISTDADSDPATSSDFDYIAGRQNI